MIDHVRHELLRLQLMVLFVVVVVVVVDAHELDGVARYELIVGGELIDVAILNDIWRCRGGSGGGGRRRRRG